MRWNQVQKRDASCGNIEELNYTINLIYAEEPL